MLFDFDKAEIRPETEKELRKIVLIIREKRQGQVLIHGHTDAKGSEEYNRVLSEKQTGRDNLSESLQKDRKNT